MKRTLPGGSQEIQLPHVSLGPGKITLSVFESAAFDTVSADSSIVASLRCETLSPNLWSGIPAQKTLVSQDSTLLTVEEAAEFLSVPVSTIYHWTSRREIPTVRVGRHLRFEKDALLRHFKTTDHTGKTDPSPIKVPPSRDVASRLSSLKSKFSRPADRTKKKE